MHAELGFFETDDQFPEHVNVSTHRRVLTVERKLAVLAAAADVALMLEHWLYFSVLHIETASCVFLQYASLPDALNEHVSDSVC